MCLKSLIDLSAELGRDIHLVQGAGGNVSLKIDEDLWVKASGTWLADSKRAPIFARLDLQGVRRKLKDGEDDFSTCLREQSGLRPSIETSLHALLPHAVVVHVHSINAIYWGVLPARRAEIAERLTGLSWQWVDYVRPGLPLTRAIERAMARQPDCNVLLLANHGIVVGGDTVQEVRVLLHEVERRLHTSSREFQPGNMLAELDTLLPPGSRLPANAIVHALASDPDARRFARGVLYPDHAVFLGTALPEVCMTEAASLAATLAAPPYCAIVVDMGVALGEGCTPGAEAMLECLALLSRKLSRSDRLRFLTEIEVGELLGWDAEAQRKNMTRSGS